MPPDEVYYSEAGILTSYKGSGQQPIPARAFAIHPTRFFPGIDSVFPIDWGSIGAEFVLQVDCSAPQIPQFEYKVDLAFLNAAGNKTGVGGSETFEGVKPCESKLLMVQVSHTSVMNPEDIESVRFSITYDSRTLNTFVPLQLSALATKRVHWHY